MDNFLILEVGSTTTNVHKYEKGKIKLIENRVIEFKKHFKKSNTIDDRDKKDLFELIDSLEDEKIFVFGTSIFRNLNNEQKNEWVREFKVKTGLDFNIVTQDEESEFTTFGAISNVSYDGKIAVMIGGGGSTEVAITENGRIIEKKGFDFGAIDVTEMYPDLKEDIAISEMDNMILKVQNMMTDFKNKADILILAGGDYLYFYETLEYKLPINKIYKNELHPFALDKNDSYKYDRKFFYEESLNKVCDKTLNAAWWEGARGMRVCVNAVCNILDVKYIVPTCINMVYGLVEKIKKDLEK